MAYLQCHETPHCVGEDRCPWDPTRNIDENELMEGNPANMARVGKKGREFLIVGKKGGNF